MKYNGELNELLLNVQRNIMEKVDDNATVDKRHQQRIVRNQEGNILIKIVINSCAKDILGLDTKDHVD